MKAISVEYRLAPEFKYPTQVQDAVLAYRMYPVEYRLIYYRVATIQRWRFFSSKEDCNHGRLSWRQVSMFGIHGNIFCSLAIATTLYLRDTSQRLPAAVVLISGWLDMTGKSETLHSNSMYDYLPLPPSKDSLMLSPLCIFYHVMHDEIVLEIQW
jgi:hypothetical protein